ncbi:MAG: methionyl-tRNA formyltransferase [Candidatus Heimdallarchaeota archaeon]
MCVKYWGESMRLVLIGNLEMAADILQELLKTHHTVVGVVVPEKKPTDSQPRFLLFENLAEKNKIPIIRTNNINDERTVESLLRLSPDLAIVIGWSQIISKKVLDIPKKGTIGLHASKLPQGRGGAPVNWSIIHGEPELGITLFYLDEGVDSGDILSQEAVKIEDSDDVKSVFGKLASVAKRMVPQVVTSIERGTASRKKQDITKATYRPRRKPNDGLICWRKKSRELFNWIRALTHPYPGAFTHKNKKKLFVWKSELYDWPRDKVALPGEIVKAIDGKGVVVKTGDGGILLTQIQEEGELEMRADEYFISQGLYVGEVLGKNEDFPPVIFTNILGENSDTLSYPTNVKTGEQRHIVARIKNYGDSTSINVYTHLDNKPIFQQSVFVPKFGRKDIKISFSVSSPGTHTLVTSFKKDDEVIDKRYLKIFVWEA